MWNLSRPDVEMKDNVQDIELRGYNPETFLTGEFAVKLSTGEISPLPVSNISDKYCRTRRDLYFVKGINRPGNIRNKDKITWGRRAGNIVESYVERILGKNTEHDPSYSSLIKIGRGLNANFENSNKKEINCLRKIEEGAKEVETGDTDWLLKLLDNNGRAELGLKLLHSLVKEGKSLDLNHIKIHQKIKPNFQIGISSSATPDFIVSDFGIVGEIKTGTEFKAHFQVTCAGYALAYENQHRGEKNINWGIIYFFPTRNPATYVRPLTFAQIYIFPIDNHLRRWFITFRDEAYDIISKTKPPKFPLKEERTHCPYCRFKNYCEEEGLELSNYGQ
jgi:CRISPR/Cas system-associated exonuclease Cas4 (RecB family)